MQVLVIIPAFNEARSIGRVIGDIPAHVDEVVVVNNASTDETERNAQAAGATVLRESRPGYGWACLRGIAYARTKNPDIVVFLDGDYSDHPDEMDRLLDPILRDEADFVVGSRITGERAPGALLPQALVGNRVACTLMRWLWGARFTDLGPFRAIRFNDLLALGMQDTTYGWTVEMQIKAVRAGLRCVEVPVSYRHRIGVSKITGTLAGTAKASAKILWTIARYAAAPAPHGVSRAVSGNDSVTRSGSVTGSASGTLRPSKLQYLQGPHPVSHPSHDGSYMKYKIWFNGELVPFEQATIHVLSHVVHYGSSVFEGIRCYNTEQGPAIFRLREHMQRLVDSAKIHRMEIPYSLDELCDACVETVAESGLDACYLRPVVFRGHGPMGVNPLNNPVETVVAVWEWGKYLGPEALEQGVDVQVSSWSRNAPNTTPSLAKAGANYLNAALIKMEALKNGFTEGIALSVDGLLSEGSGENLFIVKGGKLYTPPTGLSVLPGITRDTILTLARERGYEIEEKLIPREALYIADELFFTGTAAEVTPVRSVDHITVGEGRRGPVTAELQAAYLDVVEGRSDHDAWLTIVEPKSEAVDAEEVTA